MILFLPSGEKKFGCSLDQSTLSPVLQAQALRREEVESDTFPSFRLCAELCCPFHLWGPAVRSGHCLYGRRSRDVCESWVN